MRMFLALATISMLAVSAKAGQLLGTYNFFPTTFVASPATFNHLDVPQARIVHPGVVPAPHVENYAHHAVVENSLSESQLPPELLNPFYKNPAIASALAKESWFANKEFPVRHREAEKIPRAEIYKIISRITH